jgi:hypothetical protein
VKRVFIAFFAALGVALLGVWFTYGTFTPGRCIALALGGSSPAPRPASLQRTPLAPVGQKSLPEAMKRAGIEVQSATEECRNKRLSGELKTYKVSAECSNSRIIDAFQRAGYQYMDLVFLLTARRLEIGERIDMGQMTETQGEAAFAQAITSVVDRELQRNQGR